MSDEFDRAVKWKYFLIHLYLFILYNEPMKWKPYELLQIMWKTEV